MEKQKTKSVILIVDDSEMNRSLLSSILGDEYCIMEAENGIQAISILQDSAEEIGLMLLDIVMPEMDGFSVLSEMNRNHWIENVPVIMISSEKENSYIERAYDLGVTDYIYRPFDTFIVRRRIANTLMLYTKQKKLVEMVADQLYEQEKNSNMMVDILSHIVEFRNGESRLHIHHIHIITDLLLQQLCKKTDRYSLSQSDIRLIVTSSALHDIGKIGISDKILNKPGKLTDAEYEIMKTHTAIGASMLTSLIDYKDEPLVKTAYEICRWHHERYDGTGYPDGLTGEDIPISAQIVALADVYDALTSKRCYKVAYSHEKALEMIMHGECGAFQPDLLDCLREIGNQIQEKIHQTKSVIKSKKSLRSVMDILLRNKNAEINLDIHPFESQDKCSNELMDMVLQLRKVFDFVRFVDVSKCMQMELNKTVNMAESQHHCYALWNREQRCVNCISYQAFQHKSKMTKLEFVNSKIYFVIAKYVEFNGFPCVLEMAYQISDGSQHSEREVGNKLFIDKIKEYNQRVYIDSLTKVYNRRYYDEQVKMWNKPEGVAMLDIDDFKHINDRFGHSVGDAALRTFAKTVSSCIRETDCLIRYGGDEFILIFPSVSLEAFSDKLNAIRQAVNNISVKELPQIKLSVSIGGVHSIYPISEAVKQADHLLYQAKQNGKNAVETL